MQYSITIEVVCRITNDLNCAIEVVCQGFFALFKKIFIHKKNLMGLSATMLLTNAKRISCHSVKAYSGDAL